MAEDLFASSEFFSMRNLSGPTTTGAFWIVFRRYTTSHAEPIRARTIGRRILLRVSQRFAVVALGDVDRATIEEGAHQVEVEPWQPAAARYALAGIAAERMDLQLAGDPEPDLLDTEALVDREHVNAAAGPDHLDVGVRKASLQGRGIIEPQSLLSDASIVVGDDVACAFDSFDMVSIRFRARPRRWSTRPPPP